MQKLKEEINAVTEIKEINKHKHKHKKINLKYNFYHHNIYELKKYYTSLNSQNNSNNNTFYNHESRPRLTNDEKKKLKLIINNFNKNKVVTEELFNQEKKLRLNSINKTNYYFINSDKKHKKSKSESRNLTSKMDDIDHLSSSMIDKFNNKTTGILDISLPQNIYSKNLTNFTKQIINNFSDRMRTGKDLEYSSKRNKNAMHILDLIGDLYIKKAYIIEKKFYKAKYNNWEKENKKQEETHEIIKESSNSKTNIKEGFLNKESNTKRLNQKNHTYKNNKSKLKFEFTNSTKRRSSLMIKTSFTDNKTNNILKIENTDDIKNHNNVEDLNHSKDNNYSNNDISKIIKYNNNEFLMKEFYENSNNNRLKKIKERSKIYADSIVDMNYMPYQKMNRPFIKINNNNLERAIKINIINKYSKNIKDDYLLLYNPKILREEILKTRMKHYKTYLNNNINYNVCKKKLKPQTIRKYGYIKDSFFGIPC